MAPTVQRNALVAPFSVNSPLLDASASSVNKSKDQGEDGGGSKKSSPSGPIAVTHQKWMQSVANAINTTAQITATIPANSNSPGEPGTFAFDSNWLYIAVGKNTWRRAALNVF